ncbi:unnamed protein product [Brassica oleracea var. botrytis]|uniref:(rape) hypothetical protein n=1 Tax=Brassica napus TaxID=3708 RepID=A0A816RIK4_BRANA|nr:PREDICTED: uncharacterized protein LOC106302314 [Brassica oleracea var. oleracea]CAF2074354.1 unnamed protein product [Brassica napus]
METSNAVTPVNHLCPNLLHLFTAGDVTADPHHHRVGSTRPSTVTRRRRLPCHRSPRSTVARQCRGGSLLDSCATSFVIISLSTALWFWLEAIMIFRLYYVQDLSSMFCSRVFHDPLWNTAKVSLSSVGYLDGLVSWDHCILFQF